MRFGIYLEGKCSVVIFREGSKVLLKPYTAQGVGYTCLHVCCILYIVYSMLYTLSQDGDRDKDGRA